MSTMTKPRSTSIDTRRARACAVAMAATGAIGVAHAAVAGATRRSVDIAGLRGFLARHVRDRDRNPAYGRPRGRTTANRQRGSLTLVVSLAAGRPQTPAKRAIRLP